MAGSVLLDNTVLVNFAAAERPDLVLQTWSDAVCTTPAVRDEYRQGVANDVLPESAWGQLPLCELTEEEVAFAGRLSARLGAGERTCLALAHRRDGLFVSDDADARAVARDRGIPVTGTLGILARAVDQEIISIEEGNRLLAKMIEAGYRSPVDRLDTLL
jgi:predicted nucleic acid-binding protein